MHDIVKLSVRFQLWNVLRVAARPLPPVCSCTAATNQKGRIFPLKRKLLCGLLAALTLTCATVKAAPSRVVPVQVDGTVLSQGVNYLQSGVTYVPLRGLLDAFGGWSVWWDSSRKVAAAASGSQSVTANPSRNTVTVNGRTYSGKVFVERGRTYIPLRTLATALGGSVAWDPQLGGAAVTSPGADHNAMDLYWLSRIISAER